MSQLSPIHIPAEWKPRLSCVAKSRGFTTIAEYVRALIRNDMENANKTDMEGEGKLEKVEFFRPKVKGGNISIAQLASKSLAFSFLENEPDIYNLGDLKERHA